MGCKLERTRDSLRKKTPKDDPPELRSLYLKILSPICPLT